MEPCRKHLQVQRKDKATFYSPAEEWVLPAASTKEPEEREFVVDSGASMHMVSEKDLNSAELETMRTSRSPTTVMTANGEVQTREEATLYVEQFDSFVKVMLLEETPAVLSLRKLCEVLGYTYHWTSGQNPHLIKNGKRIDCRFPTMYHLWFLDYQRVPLQRPHTSSQDSAFDVNRYTENPVPETAEVRVESFGETRCMNPQELVTK